MSSKTDMAFALFQQGYNCAQAVLGAFCPEDGNETELALQLASGFGGGMRIGETCGAVTGAIMVIGLKKGYVAGDLAGKEISSRLTSQFMDEYARRKDTLLCRELLGYDVRDPKAQEQNKARKREVCEDAIKTAILLLEELGIE